MESEAAARITGMELGWERSWWGFGKLGKGNLGNEICVRERTLIFGDGVAEEEVQEQEEVIKALDEAMIMLAIAAALLLLDFELDYSTTFECVYSEE